MKVKIKKVPAKMQNGGSTNYTATKDPNTFKGKYGADITMDGFNESNKNGMAWSDFNTYANWVGSWAHKPKEIIPEQPYYRTTSAGNIPGSEVQLVASKYGNDPYLSQILKRNIAPKGQVPMFGNDDADAIRAYVKKYKQSLNNPQLITANPQMAFGGQTNFGLDISRDPSSMMNNVGGFDYSNTLQPIDRSGANIEAEKGESIIGDFNQDGSMEHMTVGGKKHSQGGTPLNVPDDAFIYSDTKKLKMKGSEVTPFGKSDKGKSYTPADLAKQYDINKYKAIIDNPDADPMKKKTAEMMIDNYETKLAQLALAQEAKKGFPQGVPEVAANYLNTMNDNVAPSGGNIQDTTGVKMKNGGSLQKFVAGGVDPLDIDPYHGGKTKKGSITPTRKFNAYNRGKEYLKQWEDIIPGITKLDNAKAQSLIYDYTLKNNPESIKDMWSNYGLTAKGFKDKYLTSLTDNGKFDGKDIMTPDVLSKLKSAYTDGYFGVRQLDPQKRGQLLNYPNTPRLNIAPDPYNPNINIPAPIVNSSNVPEPGQPNFTNPSTPFDYMTPDKNNVFEALSNRAGIKKYMPWEAPLDAVTANPTFYDPTRELANNNEQANTQMTFNNQFSGPQAIAARNSQVQGQSATNAANILSKYNAQNVGVSNQFAATNADIMNRLMEAKNKSAENLYAGNVIANQQYDNSTRLANDQIVKTANNAWDNRTNLGLVNDSNPYYYIDPTSGKTIFKGGRSLNSQMGSTGKQASWKDYYDQAIQEGRPASSAEKYADEMTKQLKATYTDRNIDGVPDSVRYQGVIGPRN